jgi:hypothetical protein
MRSMIDICIYVYVHIRICVCVSACAVEQLHASLQMRQRSAE